MASAERGASIVEKYGKPSGLVLIVAGLFVWGSPGAALAIIGAGTYYYSRGKEKKRQ